MEHPFQEAKPIIEKLHKHGFEAYFVGGAVRDYLIGRPIGDVDIATSAKPNEIQEIFSRTIDVGSEHGTIIVLLQGNPFEVTTFRTESDYKDFRRPSNVQFISSLKEDLKRRDFTINAIAMDQHGNIKDYFNGKEHIKQKLIQTVGNADDRFREDALRMLRAVRFVSQLSFTLDPNTKEAIVKNNELLKNISVERKTIEFEKLLKGKSTNKAINLLVETKIYRHLPGLLNQKENLINLSKLSFKHLCHQEEYWTLLAYILQIKNVERFLREWRLPVKLIRNVQTAIKHLSVIRSNGWNEKILYELGLENAYKLERVRYAIQKGERHEELLKKMYEKLPIKSRKELCVNGNDLITMLNKKPGPWLSDTLSLLEDQILLGKLQNEKQKIKEWLFTCNQKLEENY